MAKRKHSWKGRAETLALIKAAAESGVEIELEDHPNFRFTPRAGRPLEDRRPSIRRLNFERKPHMKACTSWRPPSLDVGPVDYTIPMAGDHWLVTDARRAWAKGNPSLLRETLKERMDLFSEK